MTDMQETSLEAYTNLQPVVAESRRQVYQTIHQHSNLNRVNGEWAVGLTNREAALLLGWDINRVTGRTNELAKEGLVIELQKRRCRVTGNNAIAWRCSP